MSDPRTSGSGGGVPLSVGWGMGCNGPIAVKPLAWPTEKHVTPVTVLSLITHAMIDS
jgi:hypothetical protein